MVEQMFDTVGEAVGIHVLLLITERAVWKTKEKYDEATLIKFSEEGIVLDQLQSIGEERTKLIVNEFILAFTATLGRLIGKQLVSQLMAQLPIEDAALEVTNSGFRAHVNRSSGHR